MEPLTLPPVRASVQQGGQHAWAQALRDRERALGLGTPLMTEFQRSVWRDVFKDELTDQERATAPRRRTAQREREQRGSR
jgi:hypothetical protein